MSLVLMLGGGPDHDRKGFRYWNDPGAFKPLYKKGSAGNFIGLWASFVNAVFAYLGTELVGVTVGEAQNPRKVIPKAIKLTFWRILFFYILSVLLLGTLVPYNSKSLSFANKQSTGASASPFVVAVTEAGIRGLPGFMYVHLPPSPSITFNHLQSPSISTILTILPSATPASSSSSSAPQIPTSTSQPEPSTASQKKAAPSVSSPGPTIAVSPSTHSPSAP